MATHRSHAPAQPATGHQLAELADRCLMASAEAARASRESAELMKLHVSLRQLYEAPDRDAVIAHVAEIIVSVIGCEEFAVLARESAGSASVVASMGWDARALASLAALPMPADTAVHSAPSPALPAIDGVRVTAMVPLRFAGSVSGVILLGALLPHHGGLGDADLELLDLLSRHVCAATVIAALGAAAGQCFPVAPLADAPPA